MLQITDLAAFSDKLTVSNTFHLANLYKNPSSTRYSTSICQRNISQLMHLAYFLIFASEAILYIYIFVCDLFKDAVCISDYVTSNCRITGE
jgi:Ni,Fe-hydrogenase I cytochrome b subunit